MRRVAGSATDKPSKADKTKARLIAVAKRLAQEHGSDRVTLRSIAAAARMKAGSIYYHFDSKDEILRAVLADGVGGAREAVMQALSAVGQGSPPVIRLRAALRAHLVYTVQEHFSARMKAIRRLPKRLREQHMKQEREYAAIFAGLLHELQKQGRIRPGANLSVTRMLAMGALTWTAEWYDPAGPMSLDDIADELMRILTGGAILPDMT
jgi:AcrR family transcriptional regulator